MTLGIDVVVIVGPEDLVVSVTFAEADVLDCATLVAVTTTEVFAVVAGAENIPALEMVPAVVDQVTAVLLVPLTDAVNCCEPPDTTTAVVGEMVTEMDSPLMFIASLLSP